MYKRQTCIGAIFEVGKNDLDLKRYFFFSHSGRIPEDGYISENGSPYTISRLKKLVEQRKLSEDNRGRGEVNRLYPSKEAYLNTLYDVVLGLSLIHIWQQVWVPSCYQEERKEKDLLFQMLRS